MFRSNVKYHIAPYDINTMENLFMIAGVISVIFIVCKLIESNMGDRSQQVKPLKYTFRDGVIVFASACIGMFAYNQIHQLTSNSNMNDASNVFTNGPDF